MCIHVDYSDFWKFVSQGSVATQLMRGTTTLLQIFTECAGKRI